MSTSKDLASPSTDVATNIDVMYTIVWEVCTDEDPKSPIGDAFIHITGPIQEQDIEKNPKDSLEDSTFPASVMKSPKSETIDYALKDSQIPCTASMKWDNCSATFYCQCLPDELCFSHFLLDEKETNQEMLDSWTTNDVEISHTPYGFHSNRLEGEKVFDDLERKMLFVKLDPSNGWSMKLYCKETRKGEGKVRLSEREKLNLGLDVKTSAKREELMEARTT